MKYFGHIARRGGNSLEKVIMQGCVEGRRKPGRPRTRWIDQIKSMVGCPLHELYNLVQDRQRWCDVVAVASSGVTPMGSGWANPRAPGPRGHPQGAPSLQCSSLDYPFKKVRKVPLSLSNTQVFHHFS